MKSTRDISGIVFNIQRFSLHDGPGIRVLFFLKGCPLRCVWCANPEGLTLDNQILVDPKKCVGCGDCMICPENAVYQSNNVYLTNPDLCLGCGQCISVCKHRARTKTNIPMSALEVIEICEREKPFFKNSQGGITLGGGEPLFQDEFSLEILRLAREREIHSVIETSACVKSSVFLEAISLCNHAFVDIKAVEDDVHTSITGVSNRHILKNIIKMDETLSADEKEKITFRIPLIPACNADPASIKGIGEFIQSLKGNYPIEILPFHNFGESKYEKLGLSYRFAGEGNMPKDEATPYQDLLSEMGLSVKINTH